MSLRAMKWAEQKLVLRWCQGANAEFVRSGDHQNLYLIFSEADRADFQGSAKGLFVAGRLQGSRR